MSTQVKTQKLFLTRIETLIAELTKNYQEMQREKVLKKGKKIFLGRMRSNANLFEDRIAELVYDTIGNKYEIYIDQAISMEVRQNERLKTYYPDLMIIRDSKIVGIIELKIDMGYASEDIYNQYKEMIKNIQKAKIVNTKINKEGLVADSSIQFCMILLTSANAHNRLDNIIGNDDVFVLVNSEKHPNEREMVNIPEYLEEQKKSMKNKKNWKAIYKLLRSIGRKT